MEILTTIELLFIQVICNSTMKIFERNSSKPGHCKSSTTKVICATFFISLLLLTYMYLYYRIPQTVTKPKRTVYCDITVENKNNDTDGTTEYQGLSATMNTSDGKPRYIASVKSMGRLGNQLFQFAAVLRMARRNNFKVAMPCDFRPTLNKYFQMNVTGNLTLTNTRTFHEEEWGVYSKNITNLVDKYNWTLDGYFQSFKYHDEAVLRSTLKFRPEVIKPASDVITKVRRFSSSIVCIHVRRGDFSEKSKKNYGYTIAPVGYIEKAMNFYKTTIAGEIMFIVISDDIPWCKSHIKDKATVFSIFKDPGRDLALMSLCDHAIITTGSFSWWSGWFCGGTVVYYKNFPKPGSKLREGTNMDDYYPPKWIGME